MHRRVATLAVIQRECHAEVTGPTELSLENVAHFKVFRGFLFDVENRRMAIATIEPRFMLVVGEKRRGNQAPVRIDIKLSFEFYWFVVLFQDALLRADQTEFQRLHPVNTVAKGCLGKMTQPVEPLAGSLPAAAVTFFAVFLSVSKGNLTIVTGAAIFTILIGLLGNFSGIGLHNETQFEMTNSAGILGPVRPVGEDNWQLGVLAVLSRDHFVAILPLLRLDREVKHLGHRDRHTKRCPCYGT